MTHGKATGNGEDSKGGAIYCSGCSPTISHNVISENLARYGGAGGFTATIPTPPSSATPLSEIQQATRNSPAAAGFASQTIPTQPSAATPSVGIQRWAITAAAAGLAVLVPIPTSAVTPSTGMGLLPEEGFSARVTPVPASAPTPFAEIQLLPAGDLLLESLRPRISDNSIIGNRVFQHGGGGIFCGGSSPIISGNTICGNSAAPGGGGIYCSNSNPYLFNCILWGNSPQQIFVYSGSPQVTYSDIQGGYAGTGNINAYPASWTPRTATTACSGVHPALTRAIPIRSTTIPTPPAPTWSLVLRPIRARTRPADSIQPAHSDSAIGGSFQYAIQVTNIAASTLPVLGWCNVTLPSGGTYGPVLGPVTISLASGQTLSA